jgi:hypothetical protein
MTPFQPAHLVFMGVYLLGYVLALLVAGAVLGLGFVLVVRHFDIEIHVTRRQGKLSEGSSTGAS